MPPHYKDQVDFQDHAGQGHFSFKPSFIPKSLSRYLLQILFGIDFSTLASLNRRQRRALCSRKQTWRTVNAFKLFLVVIIALSGDVECNPGPSPHAVTTQCVWEARCDTSNSSASSWNLSAPSHADQRPDFCLWESRQVDEYAFNNDYETVNITPPLSPISSQFSCVWEARNDDCHSFDISNSSKSSQNTSASSQPSTFVPDCISINSSVFNSHHLSTDSSCDLEDDMFIELSQQRKNNPSSLIAAHININSLKNKFIELQDLLTQNLVDILAVSETKLDDSYTNAIFKIDGYREPYRLDRNSKGGGIMIFVKDNIPSREIFRVSDKNLELISVELTLNNDKWCFITGYRPPSGNLKQFSRILTTHLDQMTIKYDHLYISGDLNCDILKPKSPEGKTLVDICDNFGLTSLLKTPTCFKSEHGTLIDVILTTHPRCFMHSNSITNSISDFHNLIFTIKRGKLPMPASEYNFYRSYKNFDQDEFNSHLQSIPFHVCDIFDDVDDAHWAFTTLLTDALNEHAPVKRRKYKRKSNPAMNSKWRRAMNYRTSLKTKYRKNRTKDNYELFRKQRNLCVSLKRRSIAGYFMENCNGPQSKTFWPTIKPFLSNKSNSSGKIILCENGSIIDNQSNVADIFNDYYCNIAKDAPEVNPDNHASIDYIKSNLNSQNIFHFKEVSDKSVCSLMKNLNSGKSTGCDGIPAKILKEYAPLLAPPISKLINRSITSCRFPDDLKKANVSPVFKKDDNLIKSNFRPVSILPTISKIYEKVLNEQLSLFCDGIFHDFISAFRKGFSCQSVLLRLIEDWHRALDRGNFVGAILMDLSKAFDSMPHNLIVAKLEAYGLSDDALTLISDYLNNRKQRVKIGSNYSSWCDISKGVPQGSILGPLLFNIFLNDIYYSLPLNGNTTLYNFADDNTIGVSDKDPSVLKACLEGVAIQAIDYFTQNGLLANPTKFQGIVLGPSSDSVTSFDIGQTVINTEENVKLLGVHIDDKLNFDKHISEICKKCAKQINVLKRLSPYLNFNCRMTIFKSFILANFNYCPIIWHSCSAKSAHKLERLQERALRFVYHDYTSSYEDLLSRDNLPTLHLRRIRSIAFEVHKLINNIGAPYNFNLFQKKFSNLRNSGDLDLPRTKSIKHGTRSLSYQGAFIWNQMPSSLKSCVDFKSFRSLLSKWTPGRCRCAMCDYGHINSCDCPFC